MKKTALLTVFGSCLLATSVSAAGATWYRGNTHAHTVMCGHADSTPEEVAAWYLEQGYNFLILSEHNHFIDPARVALPEDRREDFILIPGEEVTGEKVIHTTGMNTRLLVDWRFNSEQKSEIIQNHVDGVKAAGGEAILNHPNFHYAVRAEDMKPVRGLHMFELYNGHPHVNNWGDADNPSTEVLWDDLLTSGMVVYAVASDDVHSLKDLHPNASNAGRGWVMVHSDELTPDAITAAMFRGDFYASSGVYLKELTAGPRSYKVEVDVAATERALESKYLFGRKVEPGPDRIEIEFVGPSGAVLAREEGTAARFRIRGDQAYVRCRVSFYRTVREVPRAYYAWTQPVFTDGRVERVLSADAALFKSK